MRERKLGLLRPDDRSLRFERASLYRGDALAAYDGWLAPTVIVSDGPYGLGKFPGEPTSPDALAEWYAPHAAAWAMPVGGVAQLLYMWWEMHKLGLRVTLGKPGKHPEVRTMLLRFAPAAMGVGVLQLSLLVDNITASFTHQEAAVSYLTYANRFYQLPMALIGIAVATVLLPHLSVLLGKGDKQGASASFMDAVQGCMVLAGGATVWLFMLAPEMIGRKRSSSKTSDTDPALTKGRLRGPKDVS